METKHYSGLNDSEVQQSRKQFGENIITPPPHTPLWKLFLEKFKDPIIRILLVAAVLSLIISIMHNEYAETIGIFFAIFLATGVGFWFEMDANKKFELLNQVNDDIHIKVLRNGNIHEIPKREIVVGDIVVLETGEEIPADGELIEAIYLQELTFSTERKYMATRSCRFRSGGYLPFQQNHEGYHYSQRALCLQSRKSR